MKKYLIKHWVNADFIMEKVVNEDEIDIPNNNLKKHKTLDGSFSVVVLQESLQVKRTSYEEYDEKLNISSKDGVSDQ